MELTVIKCPNCGANMSEEYRQGNRFVCPYCDSTIWIGNIEKIENTENVEVHDEVEDNRHFTLCYISGKLADNKDLTNIVNNICDLQNDYPTSDHIFQKLIEVLNNKKETATKNWMSNEHKTVSNLIKLEPGEELVMFKTAALFNLNKLKTGMFLTNKRVGYLEHKKVFSFHYEEVDSFIVEIGLGTAVWWYPNGNENIFVSSLGVDTNEMAVILMYVLLKISEATAPDHLVELKMKG